MHDGQLSSLRLSTWDDAYRCCSHPLGSWHVVIREMAIAQNLNNITTESLHFREHCTLLLWYSLQPPWLMNRLNKSIGRQKRKIVPKNLNIKFSELVDVPRV